MKKNQLLLFHLNVHSFILVCRNKSYTILMFCDNLCCYEIKYLKKIFIWVMCLKLADIKTHLFILLENYVQGGWWCRLFFINTMDCINLTVSFTIFQCNKKKLLPSYILECSHYSTLVQLPREPVWYSILLLLIPPTSFTLDTWHLHNGLAVSPI